MSEHTARIEWCRDPNEPYLNQQYSRAHEWYFDGGAVVPASPSPHIVPPPLSVEANVDPEEAFVASVSSCHMLFFLSLAAKQKFIIDRYVDQATGVLGKNAANQMAMTHITLHPKVDFAPDHAPSPDQLEQLHHLAHEHCFIAHSIKSTVEVDIIP